MYIPIVMAVDLHVEDVNTARDTLAELMRGFSEHLSELPDPLGEGLFESGESTLNYEPQTDFAENLPLSSDEAL